MIARLLLCLSASLPKSSARRAGDVDDDHKDDQLHLVEPECAADNSGKVINIMMPSL